MVTAQTCRRRQIAAEQQQLSEVPGWYLDEGKLLELLLGVGPNKAKQILAHGRLKELKDASIAEIKAKYPVTDRQSQILYATSVIAKKFETHILDSDTKKITCPEDGVNIMRSRMCDLVQEELHVITLNYSNKIMQMQMVYRGTVNSSVVRTSEVVRPAVLLNAPAILILHNHPAGDPTPSTADVHATQEIYKACKVMGIELMDHVVMGKHRFVSIRDQEGSKIWK